MSKARNQVAGVLAAAATTFAVASCIPAEDKCDPSTVQSVQLTTTLIPDATHNAFYLATPATARSACDAHYTFNFHWANVARSQADTVRPPLNGLDKAFRVDSDTLFWYNTGPVRSGGTAVINWLVDITDHFATAPSPQSLYYIRTGMTSGTVADSVAVSATITYYPQ